MNKHDQAEFNELSTSVARNAVAVVDAMVQRGAIKGEELLTLGQLRSSCLRLVALAEAAEVNELPDS